MLLAVIGALAIGVWYLARPQAGRLLFELTGNLQLDDDQRSMVAIISDEFAGAGLGWLVPAAVANAYAESLLDPNAIGDNGHAVGLFQLNDASSAAAGYGMSVAERQDPYINTRRIIEEAVDLGARNLPGNMTHADLTDWFARRVENCAHCGGTASSSDSDLARRRRILLGLYPDIADLQAR